MVREKNIKTLYHYNSIRQIVKASKQNDIEAINLISDSLAFYIQNNHLKGCLIAVPSSKKSTETIAKNIALKINKPFCNSLFKFNAPSNCQLRIKTDSRKYLSVMEIMKYIRVRKYPKSKNIILIDDVSTSGNTFKACCQILKGYNIKCIAFANGSRKSW